MDPARKLNIAMVCDPVTDYTAGVFVTTQRLSLLLQERGHKVIFIAAKSKLSPKKIDDYHGIKVYRFFGILLPKTEGRWYNAFPTIGQLKKVFEEEKIDVVHIMLPTPMAFIAIKAAQSLGIKVVAHSHAQAENVFLHVPKILGRDLLSKLYEKYMAWIYNHAEKLIFPSEFAKQLLWKPGMKPSIVISNGVNLKHYRKMEVGNFFERFNLPRDAFHILYVGRLHPEKEVDVLLKALEEVKDKYPSINAMIVGGGHMEGWLQKLARKLKLEKEARFLGMVSDEDKILAYSACDVFVLPSIAELEGMVVLEAMACGKPVIIANAPMSAARFFVKGNGLLFKAGDPGDLALQILTLIQNSKLRGEMGEMSLKDVKDYDIERSVSKLEELYYSVLGQ
jgi:glycosyltransferase involved in cell wall biosynthesis